MEKTNPYRAPSADVTVPLGSGRDHTRSFDPSGRFGRLSYVAWVMLVGIVMNPDSTHQWQQTLQAT